MSTMHVKIVTEYLLISIKTCQNALTYAFQAGGPTG